MLCPQVRGGLDKLTAEVRDCALLGMNSKFLHEDVHTFSIPFDTRGINYFGVLPKQQHNKNSDFIILAERPTEKGCSTHCTLHKNARWCGCRRLVSELTQGVMCSEDNDKTQCRNSLSLSLSLSLSAREDTGALWEDTGPFGPPGWPRDPLACTLFSPGEN